MFEEMKFIESYSFQKCISNFGTDGMILNRVGGASMPFATNRGNENSNANGKKLEPYIKHTLLIRKSKELPE